MRLCLLICHVLQHSKVALGVQEYNYSCAVNVLNVPSEAADISRRGS